MNIETADHLSSLRPDVGQEPESGIVQIANYGREREGLIPLWIGEGDLPTPEFICKAAYDAMRAGETFYTYQRGIPALRQALADYHARIYGHAFDPENFFVTGSGMQAIMNVVQAVAGEGDEVVMASPAWPNYPAALRLNGARPVEVPMVFGEDRWTVDLDRLFDACTHRTKAIFVNSPSNPLGHVMTTDELKAIRDFARDRGLWLIADEVYARFVYADLGGNRNVSPSVLDICDPEERLICTNTFSKNWAMTGWRVGWIMGPRSLGQVFENLVQYNTSGVPAFLQRGCVAALEHGEPFLAEQIARARAGREIVCDALGSSDRVRFQRPDGAFYLFFSIDGIEDSRAAARRMIDEASVGLAPGSAFGPGGEGWFRLCYARSEDGLREGMDRLMSWIRDKA